MATGVVVKVQRLQASNDRSRTVGKTILIYAEGRKRMQEREINNHEEVLMGSAQKMFMLANWSSIVGWGIYAKAPKQDYTW